MLHRLAWSIAVGAALVTSLLTATPASAAPLTIGDFFYDTDPFFGPVFSVSNFSDATLDDGGGTFTALTLNLFDGDALVLATELGPLDPGGSIDTLVQDLSLLTFDSATLVAAFSLAGTVSVDPIAAIVFSGAFPSFTGTEHLDSFIHFTPPDSAVPEPATLILAIAAGVALAAVRGRSRLATRHRHQVRG
jgi:hypothetical protein